MKPIFLSEIPHSEAKRLVDTGAPVAVLVNPVEYHGPHLPLDTDTFLSLGALGALYEKLGPGAPPLLVHSVVRMGCGAVRGPGTSPGYAPTVRETVRGACRGLRSIGAKKAILMTFHGEPLHNLELERGARLLRSWGIPTICPMNSLMSESVMLKPGDYADVLARIPDEKARAFYHDHLNSDFHGGLFETSLMLRWRPEAVAPDWKNVPPCPFPRRRPALSRLSGLFRAMGRAKLAAEIDFANDAIAWTKEHSRCGYTGWPGLSTAEIGRVFSDAVSGMMARDFRAYFDERAAPPQPIFKWIGTLSLGGRL